MTATDVNDDAVWYWLTIAMGISSLAAYFLSSIFTVLPLPVERILFIAFGPTLALATFSAGRLLRQQVGTRPFFELGVLSTVIAGVTVNMMAVIQDSNFTVMHQRIIAAEFDATKDILQRILWGVNNVQISLDIVFDIWISAGCAFFAAGMIFYLKSRWFGAAGIVIALMALVVNFATLPHPPAEAGLFDPGPAVATWFGLFLAAIIYRHRRLMHP